MVPSGLRSKGMPKCSSSYTALGASRTMNSIASWSPSQSEPLTVSYMCHCQWSSLMLPSEALTPPWAATVCERVGKTLDSTATDKPAWASCSEQRKPAPPAPTTTTSNWRRGRDFLTAATLETPENLTEEDHCGHQPQNGQDLQVQAQAGGMGVIHPDVAHADSGVPGQRKNGQRRQQLPHRQRAHCKGKEGAPGFEIQAGDEDGVQDQDQRID